MKMNVDKDKGVAVIVLPKKVAREETVQLSQCVNELLAAGLGQITFDMKNTTMLDSASLGVLVCARRDHPADTVKMVIANPTAYIRDILKNTGFDRLFPITNMEAAS
jgi:anti-anti-sigma factor